MPRPPIDRTKSSVIVPWSKLKYLVKPRFTKRILADTDGTPRAVANWYQANNKLDDECYTPFSVWERFLKESVINDRTEFYEPFYGDGTAISGLIKNGYKIHGAPGDFWDIDWATAPAYPILTNPPFSSKWIIIERLLELKREFHMILPWQVFFAHRYKLDELKKLYGGDYTWLNLSKTKEREFITPTGAIKCVGCGVLSWVFI